MRGQRFVHERELAIKMRKQGLSIVAIEQKVKINRSTLSGWFKNIHLSPKKKELLEKSKMDALRRARTKAKEWHIAAKNNRLIIAEKEAHSVLSQIDFKQKSILEFALAMLYWGEGFKKSTETGLGNSDPLLVSLFVKLLRVSFSIPVHQIRCELYLRYDQDEEKEKLFWSKTTGIPLSGFRYVPKDERTKSSKTFEGYHGVCAVRCGNVAIARKLGNISKLFAEHLLGRA